MFCPTRFVVDATENSQEGGVATDVCRLGGPGGETGTGEED